VSLACANWFSCGASLARLVYGLPGNWPGAGEHLTALPL
jgi:hypothetical protein